MIVYRFMFISIVGFGEVSTSPIELGASSVKGGLEPLAGSLALSSPLADTLIVSVSLCNGLLQYSFTGRYQNRKNPNVSDRDA